MRESSMIIVSSVYPAPPILQHMWVTCVPPLSLLERQTGFVRTAAEPPAKSNRAPMGPADDRSV
jgi:hypothetical protein